MEKRTNTRVQLMAYLAAKKHAVSFAFLASRRRKLYNSGYLCAVFARRS
jgi:hypothetical protein